MIIGTTRAARVFAFSAPVDLRKSYDGLFGLVQTGLARESVAQAVQGALWDGTGLCIFQKRLEKGTFAKLWRDDGWSGRAPDSDELALYVEGCTFVGKHALSPIAVERKPLVSDRGM